MARLVDWERIAALCLIATVGTGCAARSGTIPRPLPHPTTESPGAPPSATTPIAETHAIVTTALDLRGSPYRDGGETLEGFDCSGFTRYVFARHGIDLPRRAADQYETGTPIDLDRLAAGDLVFFTTVTPGASHVGLSTGDGQFVHAPSRRGRVRVERLSSTYWAKRYVGARRIVGRGPTER